MRRKLTLHKETLTEITSADLASVAGGATALCPTPQCVTDYIDRLISAAVYPCVSLQNC